MEEARTKNKFSREKSQKSIAQIVISGMMLALAIAMEGISKCIPFFSWPLGGSVSITMVPLILVGLYCGPLYGVVISVLFGVFNFLLDGVISWTPNVTAVILSLILDYVIGFGACGLSSIFRKKFFQKDRFACLYATLLCGSVRLVSSFFSGMIVFTTAFDYSSTSGLAPAFTWAGFTYSLGYNAGYMLPSIALDILVFFVLIKPLFISLDTTIVKNLAPKNSEETKSLPLPSFLQMLPIYLLFEVAFGIVSMIPSLKVSYFGYFGIMLGVGLVSYILVGLIKKKDEMSVNQRILYIVYLFVSLVGIALCITGCVSPVTYGAASYSE